MPLPEGVDISHILSQMTITLLILFFLGSLFGYLIEVLFRRFFSAKRWVNPGFMKGPWLPLYGFGVVLMFLLTALFQYILSEAGLPFYDPWGFYGEGRGASAFDLIPIVLMGLSLILLEFIAGVIFVKGFKVRLWDYTNMRGNVMGVICPLFDIIWFVAAILYYYLLNPVVAYLFGELYGFLFPMGGNTSHIYIIFLLGLLYGLMAYDLIVSIGLFDKISAAARKSGVLERYEKWKENQKENLSATKERFLELLPASLQERAQKEGSAKENLAKKAEESAFYRRLKNLFLIDPNKKKGSGDNYDEKGRPISFEEEERRNEKEDK